MKDGDGAVLEESVEKYDKIFMGEVPIMLRSSYCSLNDRTNRELTTLGECPYDQASRDALSDCITPAASVLMCGAAPTQPLLRAG